jgi:hypothetical protein
VNITGAVLPSPTYLTPMEKFNIDCHRLLGLKLDSPMLLAF